MRGQRKSSGTDATITFTFESAYNQIVQPTSYVSLSQYFIAHWMPAITGAGLKILLQLRSMGYYSPKAGVQRGDIDIEQKELAALCGLSHSTLKRAFADDPVLSAYVQRVFEVKRDPRTGRIIKEHYLYVVKMDDVLVPADKVKLEEMLQGLDKPGDLPKGQNDPSDLAPIAQNELSDVQSEPPTGQNEPPRGQNDPSLKGSLNTPTTLNTLDTPAAAPEVFASLFSEEKNEPEGEIPDRNNLSLLAQAKLAEVAWAKLPAADRAPWLTQGERELSALFAGSGLSVKPKLIEARGASLYEMSLRGVGRKTA